MTLDNREPTLATYIFDFDGTIADSFSIACSFLENHANHLGCKPLTPTELLALKDMDAREALAYLGIPLWRVGFFVRKLRKMANKRVDEITIFPEWFSILKKLHQSQHQIGLLSSNSKDTVEFVLKKYRLFELFDFIACDKPLFGKKRCLHKLIHQKKLDASMTYYVGDEVRDIEAAHATNIHSIAVSWGFNSNARLQQANPGQLIITFEELAHLLCNR